MVDEKTENAEVQEVVATPVGAAAPAVAEPPKALPNTTLRTLTSWQTDDGRRIEQYTRVDEIPIGVPPGMDMATLQVPPSIPDESLFVGVMKIRTPLGAEELRFQVPGKTINEAMEQYPALAQVKYQEWFKQFEEARKKFEQQQAGNKAPGIVKASAEDLQQVNKLAAQKAAGKLTV